MDPMSPAAPIVCRNLMSGRKAFRTSLPQYVKSIAVFGTEVAESWRPRSSRLVSEAAPTPGPVGVREFQQAAELALEVLREARHDLTVRAASRIETPHDGSNFYTRHARLAAGGRAS